jgi:ATP-binding cassette subfamily F protein 3
MSILAVDNLSKYFGSRCLMEQVSFHIEEKDRVGLVGANGTGKTTLFQLLVGKQDGDSGGVVRASGLKIGTMEQHVPEDTTLTANEWILTAFEDLLDLEKQLEEIQKQVEKGNADEKLLMRQQHLREQFEREGGLWFRSRAQSALNGLGFTEAQKNLPLASLSGGQRSKLGLARLLVSRAGLLLLDEPTNHLDIAAIGWLEEFLKGYEGAFIVISHDRYFLDKVTEKTMELEHQRLRVFSGNYTTYLSFKKEQQKVAEHHYQQQIKEIKRLEDAVTEMRRWNREKSIKRAESKQKVIDKLTDSLEKPEQEEGTIFFSFKAKQPGPVEVLNARGLTFGFEDKPLYRQTDFSLRKGERVFLIGPNGCGKTTLLKQLLHQVRGQGFIEYGPGVTVGYYDQTGQQLHPEKSVLDEIWDEYPGMDQTSVRNALAAFLFKGEQVFKKIETCSGGERARVALLKIMLKGTNLLLLDEPTNHLDIGSREALEEALAGYDGTLLMVSHDRYFINKLADRVLWLTQEGIRNFEGDYDSFLAAMEQKKETPEKKNGPGAGGQDYKARKQRESEIRKLKTAITRAEEEIERLEQLVLQLREQIEDPSVAADYVKIMELTKQLNETEEQIEVMTLRWTEDSDRLEELE